MLQKRFVQLSVLGLLVFLAAACAPSSLFATPTPIIKIVYVTTTPVSGTPQPPTLTPTVIRTPFITRTPVTPKPTATFPPDRIVNCEKAFPNHVSGPVSPHGITPGITTMGEVEQILGPADSVFDDSTTWGYDPNKDRDYAIFIDFDADNVVIFFDLFYDHDLSVGYQLGSFLEEYGCPDMIRLIDYLEGDHPDDESFELDYEEAALIYFDIGVNVYLYYPFKLSDSIITVSHSPYRTVKDVLAYYGLKFSPKVTWEDIVVMP